MTQQQAVPKHGIFTTLRDLTKRGREQDPRRQTDPYLLQVFWQLHALKMQLLWGQQPGKAAWRC